MRPVRPETATAAPLTAVPLAFCTLTVSGLTCDAVYQVPPGTVNDWVSVVGYALGTGWVTAVE